MHSCVELGGQVMSSISWDYVFNESDQSPWFESPYGDPCVYLDDPLRSLYALDQTFSASGSASDSHLHGSSQEGVANVPSVDVSELPPLFNEDLPHTKLFLSYVEEHIKKYFLSVGDPVQSNEITSVEDHEESSKRHRSPNWIPEENLPFLELKEEAQEKGMGKPWNYISEGLRDRYNFDRSAKVCEDHWGTLLKGFKAIRKNESSRPCVSYWDMDNDERSRKKLPPTFLLEWYKMMEGIELAGKKKRPRSADHGGNQTSDRKYSGTKGFGATLEENSHLLKKLGPFIKRQIGDYVDSEVEGVGFRMTSNVTSKQEAILTSMIPHVKHQVEAAAISALELSILTGKFVGDEQDLITMLASDVGIRKIIKDALDSALQPVAFDLQALAQEEQKDQARLQAIEEQKRALDLEAKNIISKRRRGGRHDQRAQETSKRQVPRGKNYSTAGKIVPKFKGLRIAGDQGGVSILEDE
ncbi:hypothetical protein KC19_6G064500 [Ceratodon purpureus]|uniref:Myb-like domain-containing protein n=1 Tax=Ceratodon purpureus TaxID=3225 RepID=A0A8T0HBF5_CERPU|nr:hypothetical protein KC19_6G064500 [Ceratodon purpureus]